MRWFFLMLFLVTTYAKGQGTTYFGNHEEGWFWYQEIEEEKKKQENPQPMNVNERMALIRKRVEEALNTAILNPTEENLKNYAQVYFDVINKSSMFSNAYKLMLLRNPQYDYYLKYPVNHNARIIHDREQAREIEASIRNLAKSHGFFFFFAGNCDYCHLFSPTVKRFSEKYGIHIMPVSLDGGILPEFPNPIRDNGAARALGVTRWPSLVAFDSKTKNVMPITNGAVSVSDLEEAIFRYSKMQEMVTHE